MEQRLHTRFLVVFLLGIALFIKGCRRLETPTNIPASPTTVHIIVTSTLLESPIIASPENTTVIPTQSPTMIPAYIHYVPPDKANIHLEFDYSGSWIFNSDMSDKNLMTLWFGDSRFQTIATPAPSDYHPTPNDFGNVSITIWSVKPDQPLDNLVKPHKEGYSGMSWIKTLNEYKTTLGGNNAQVFEYEIDYAELYTSVMFERDTFFVVNDQLYQVTFQVAEKERGNEFEKDYEYFFNSLKIVQ